MFGLVVTIIAVALAAALAVATIYMGGDAFNNGKTKAETATYVNQAQQVSGAVDFFVAREGRLPSSVDELQPDYLMSMPKPPTDKGEWDIDGVGLSLQVDNTDTCKDVNEESGVPDSLINAGSDYPTCQDMANADVDVLYYCCEDQSGGT